MRHRLTGLRRFFSLVIVFAFFGTAAAADEDPYADLRTDMIRTIVDHARYIAGALGGEGIDPRVLNVMRAAPRHAFVPESAPAGATGNWWQWLFRSGTDKVQAYGDRPVPIGYGQTMSQPFIVALMTDLLRTRTDHVVLEIGTGSGYQAAVLSPLVKRVCTVEIIPQLAKSAAAALNGLGYDNVKMRTGDGYNGWQACGPFDGIVVTAAASHIPLPLVRQLKPGGRMIIPVGTPFTVQHLTLVEKDAGGVVTTRQLLPVAFVPLVRFE